MNPNSRLTRFLLESPFLPILFALVPGALVLSRVMHLVLPFQLSTRMMYGSAACLLICVLARFVSCLVRFSKDIRYCSVRPLTARMTQSVKSPGELRGELVAAGYRFDGAGWYAEKRDFGFWGTLMLYSGLLLVSFTGIRDNLNQFSGTTFHGLGVPTSLSKPGNYYPLIKGPFASVEKLPLLGINKQIFPNAEYPKGASEIVLLTKEKVPFFQKMLVSMGEPARYKDFDIFLAKLLVDASFTVKLAGAPGTTVIEEVVKLNPLLKKEGGFDFYGTFGSPEAGEGDLYYDSSANSFRLVLTRGGKKILDTDYAFQQYREKTVGNYLVRFNGMGRWSELHVVHRRNLALIVFAAALALAGLLVRIACRPRRVWLEAAADGCRIWGSWKQGDIK